MKQTKPWNRVKVDDECLINLKLSLLKSTFTILNTWNFQ